MLVRQHRHVDPGGISAPLLRASRPQHPQLAQECPSCGPHRDGWDGGSRHATVPPPIYHPPRAAGLLPHIPTGPALPPGLANSTARRLDECSHRPSRCCLLPCAHNSAAPRATPHGASVWLGGVQRHGPVPGWGRALPTGVCKDSSVECHDGDCLQRPGCPVRLQAGGCCHQPG
jgi:hypothetical protein